VRLRWKVLLGLGVVLAALLALNAIALDQQTKAARVTVPGGEIMRLAGGDVQVLDEPAQAARPGAPIVLLHCYLCSLRWWDELAPLLAEEHRVIRIDFLGHGGSEKPSEGYSIENQAQLVAGALSELEVQGAVVVGQSMGAAMAVSLAETSSQLVDRVVDISLAATNEGGSLPLLARLGYVPVLGQAMYRLTPDFAIRSEFGNAFAPDFELTPELEEMIVADYRAMTYPAYDRAQGALSEFRDEEALNARMTAAAVPLMAIFGEEDQIVDAAQAEESLSNVPGVRLVTLPEVGHTPQIEAPEETAALIEEFASAAVVAEGGSPTDQ